MMTHARNFGLIAALSLGPAVANSFARFAYALVLPAMRSDLAWNYTQAGWLNTANAIGYLLGALFTVPSAVTALVKNSLPKASWGAAVAVFTVAFAIGQSIGPIFTGWLSDATSSLFAGLAGSAIILLLAGVAALRQKDTVADAAIAPATARPSDG